MKKATIAFAILAVALACAMCAAVAYLYRDMLCAIEHGGASAPASIAFLWAIPFGVACAACVALAIIFNRKSKKGGA